ncbi:MAG: DnaD domain protein [Clostridia bacterium]|nr:DnaD domain protein [Clostridia bacterium]
MARDSFIFYRSFYDALNELPKENQADTYRAIARYALDQEETELTGISKAIFSLVKPQLDANYKKYENGKQKKSKTEANDKQKVSKTGTNVNDNVNVNGNVNVNVNANDNVGDSCVDGLQKIIDFYQNNIGLITPYAVDVFADYAKEMPYDVIIYAMQRAVEANIRTIKYIKGTLNNWQNAGVKTLIQAKEESENYRKSKQVINTCETEEEKKQRKLKALEEALGSD